MTSCLNMRSLLALLLLLPSVALGQDAAPALKVPEPASFLTLSGPLGWAVIGGVSAAFTAMATVIGHLWRAGQAQSVTHAEEVQTVRAGYQQALVDKTVAEVAALERHAAELVRLDDRYASSQERFTDAILGKIS